MPARELPSIDRIMGHHSVRALSSQYGRAWVTDVVRYQLSQTRSMVLSGIVTPALESIVSLIVKKMHEIGQIGSRAIINATGVILHTNLGRAPLGSEAAQAILDTVQNYSDLEIDLLTGLRESRQKQVKDLLCYLTGAESGMVVNNNAAAMLLALSATSAGKEVIVSRGEEIEIGGSFRIPDVLKQSGTLMVEVGTTNRTYIHDYESAITENTSALLKVHPSNFRIEGFTHTPDIAELTQMARKHGVLVFHDIGSGCLFETEKYGLTHEPMPQESLAKGADLVLFSGDKLLGGPQSGIIVGKAEIIELLEKHPMYRALRVDKMNLASLSATLLYYMKGEADTKLPVWQMILESETNLKQRAKKWAQAIGARAIVIQGSSTIGGGSLPEETLPSWLVAIDCGKQSAKCLELVEKLRIGKPPIIARIDANMVLFDPRTVLQQEDSVFLQRVKEAIRD